MRFVQMTIVSSLICGLFSLCVEEVHPDFRLWLSSKPTAAFPSSVLKSSVKVSGKLYI